MSDQDPTKPIPNDEKFKPQNVAEPGAQTEPPARDGDKPADTGGRDVPKGSQQKIGRKTGGAR
ncbi:hypothetical protein MKP08_09250 [Erythrobacter sp. LQ02-29]|uniref:hypothetical protein n=1 Tax=unclassified Erythrobacter TaxID=2633097 RepID=UPI001BFC0CA9|nr:MULTISPECIES: hypothetical protein [unclassified Erythrobacter]MCP9222932.1 hypothetical protein [Erythrobacter sp. LQ02-29]QWC55870.1 hypothetical protein F7D01_01100 [Erythrobacter sp. 3-20A1M]